MQRGRPLPLPLRGITVTSVEPLQPLVRAVQAHTRAPTVRIVFDSDQSPDAYEEAIAALRPHAYLLGQVMDSADLARFPAAAVARRAQALLDAHGDQIDVWEIGNELNGSWAGTSPQEINPKVLAAYRAVKGRNGRTALTLNFWSGPHCYQRDWEAPLVYAGTVPAEIREGLDYLLLSVYETACSPSQRPSAAELGASLTALGALFPEARLGLGEVGAQGREDGLRRDPTLSEKRRLAERYYGMNAELRAQVGSRFVGGYFWWYYVQDAVFPRRDLSLWPALERLLSQL